MSQLINKEVIFIQVSRVIWVKQLICFYTSQVDSIFFLKVFLRFIEKYYFSPFMSHVTLHLEINKAFSSST